MASTRYFGAEDPTIVFASGKNGDTVFSNPINVNDSSTHPPVPPPSSEQLSTDPCDLPSQNFGRQQSLRRRRIPATIREEGQGEAPTQPTVITAQPPSALDYPQLAHLNEKISKKEQRTPHQSTGLQTLRHIYFPKVSRSARSIFSSFSPWKPFFKRIHSRFGTGVLSYFVFLRWLIYLNFFLFVLWSGFVLVPQAIWHSTPQGMTAARAAMTSRLTCVDRNLTRGMLLCASGHVVYNSSDTCTGHFVSRECSGSSPVMEGSNTLSVSNNESTCTTTNSVEWWLCTEVEATISPGQHILDFISGSGFIYNTSELFIGIYTNETINSVYDLPLAYLLTGGAFFVISVLAIIVRLGFIYHENYISLGKGEGADIFNKIFAGWDFNIANKKSSEHHQKTISRELRELYEEVKSRDQKRSNAEWFAIIFLRTLTNLFVFLCLAGAAVVIYYAVFLELQELNNTSLLSAFVIAVLNVVLPFIFSFLPRFERYKKMSTAIRMTVFRLLLVRVSSLITLIVVVLQQIQCTQPTPEEKGTKCSVDFDLSQVINITSSNRVCPECWETVIGQKFYEQALFTFVILTGGTILVDTGRNILSRITWPCTKRKINFREFDIPKSVLDLVYLQAIVWLGFFFSPVIPGIAVITFFLLFWIKMASTFINLEPSKEAYKAAKKDFTFQFILLITLLACMLPVGFAIARIVPSQNPGCGPFRGQPFIYSIVENRTDSLSCAEQAATGFFTSAAFVVPLILLLIMLVVGLFMAFRARGRTVVLLSKQLELENADKSYLLDKYNINSVTNERNENGGQIDGGGMEESVTTERVENHGEVLQPAYSMSTLPGSNYPSSKAVSQARKHSQDLLPQETSGLSAYSRRRTSSSNVLTDPSVFGAFPRMSESDVRYPSSNVRGSIESFGIYPDSGYQMKPQRMSMSSDAHYQPQYEDPTTELPVDPDISHATISTNL